jgi:hypothetical protein
VRVVAGRDLEPELVFCRGQCRVGVVDDDDAQIERLAAVAGDPESGLAIDQGLERRDEDGLPTVEVGAIGVVDYGQTEPSRFASCRTRVAR